MDMEERVKKLEAEAVATNNRLWELTARIGRLEKLLLDAISPGTMGDDDYSTLDGKQTFQELVNVSFRFNQLLPHVAVLLGVSDNAAVKNGKLSIQNGSSSAGRAPAPTPAPVSRTIFVTERPSSSTKPVIAPKPKLEPPKAKSAPVAQAPSKKKSKNKSADVVSASSAKNQVVQNGKSGKKQGGSVKNGPRSAPLGRQNDTESEDAMYETMSETDSLHPSDDGFKKKKVGKPCRKVCNNTQGHPCNIVHDPAEPCPPCQKLMTDLKLKCGHRTSVMCHRMSKISEFCSECESKRLIHEAPASSSLPVIPFAYDYDPFQSPAEADFKKVREILKKISFTNFDKLSDDFVAIVNSESKYLPEFANLFVERAVMDAYNQPLLATYAKLISSAINRPSGRLRMLAIEVTNTLCNVVTVLFKLPSNEKPPVFVTSLLRKKEIVEMEQRTRNYGVLRFVGEMYNYDVLELSDLKDRVIEPLLETGTDETLDYLCKILTLVGSRINTEISNSGEIADRIWFDGLFAKLEVCSSDPVRSNPIKFAIQNLIELRKAGWDRFKKKENAVDQYMTPTEGAFASVDESLPSMEPPARVKKTPGSSSKPKVKPATDNLPGRSNAGYDLANFLDRWEEAPWGEHTDPLAALPPINLSQAMSVTGSGQYSPGYPTSFHSSFMASGAMGVSVTSSRASSPAVSISSAPALNHKPVKEIDAKRLFDQYVPRDTTPQPERIKWLKQKFKDQNKTQRLAVIRNLSKLMTSLQSRKEIAAMGHLLDVLIRAKIITEEVLINALQSGVMLELPILYKHVPPKEYDDIVADVASALVTCWEPRLEDFAWLAALGTTMHETNRTVWYYFSYRVLEIVLDRKKLKATRACYNQTSSKSILKEQAKNLKIV